MEYELEPTIAKGNDEALVELLDRLSPEDHTTVTLALVRAGDVGRKRGRSEMAATIVATA